MVKGKAREEKREREMRIRERCWEEGGGGEIGNAVVIGWGKEEMRGNEGEE